MMIKTLSRGVIPLLSLTLCAWAQESENKAQLEASLESKQGELSSGLTTIKKAVRAPEQLRAKIDEFNSLNRELIEEAKADEAALAALSPRKEVAAPVEGLTDKELELRGIRQEIAEAKKELKAAATVDQKLNAEKYRRLLEEFRELNTELLQQEKALELEVRLERGERLPTISEDLETSSMSEEDRVALGEKLKLVESKKEVRRSSLSPEQRRRGLDVINAADRQ